MLNHGQLNIQVCAVYFFCLLVVCQTDSFGNGVMIAWRNAQLTFGEYSELWK